MAVTELPSNGLVQSVEPGEPATLEPLKVDLRYLNAKFDNDPLLGGHTHDGTAGQAPKIGLSGLTQEVIVQMGMPNCKFRAVTALREHVAAFSYRIDIDGDVGTTVTMPAPSGYFLYEGDGAYALSLPMSALSTLKVYTDDILRVNLTGINYLFSIIAAFTRHQPEEGNDYTNSSVTINYGIPKS